MDYVGYIQVVVFVLVAFLSLFCSYKLLRRQKPKSKSNIRNISKRKYTKYYNPDNNYFRNNPEPVDLTHEYVESVWDELK